MTRQQWTRQSANDNLEVSILSAVVEPSAHSNYVSFGLTQPVNLA